MTDIFASLPKRCFRVIYADPPWKYETWSEKGQGRSPPYRKMPLEEICTMPVAELAAPDCLLLMWVTGPFLRKSFDVLDAWGFEYKTIGFDWMKADVSTVDLFPLPKDAQMKQGHWTRSNSEPCLLATKGSPKRRNKGVRAGVIEPPRQSGRKPDCLYERIERLIDGPYLELFARSTRRGWVSWGDQAGIFGEVGDGQGTARNYAGARTVRA